MARIISFEYYRESEIFNKILFQINSVTVTLLSSSVCMWYPSPSQHHLRHLTESEPKNILPPNKLESKTPIFYTHAMICHELNV